MNLIMKIIRKLFLIKEIISKLGVVHFRRYRLLSTPWFAIYIHQICQSDDDKEMHDHPWDYKSLILTGAYREQYAIAPTFNITHTQNQYAGLVIERKGEDVHKLTLLSPEVWTLVIVSGRNREWGYRYVDGSWVDHKTYRQLKNSK